MAAPLDKNHERPNGADKERSTRRTAQVEAVLNALETLAFDRTDDEREFNRIDELSIQNWIRA